MTMKIGGTQIDTFTEGYLECMFWIHNEELEDKTIHDLAGDALIKIIEDCSKFDGQNREILDKVGDDAQHGHDFYLTRNWHGAGFWDRGYGELGDILTVSAHQFDQQSPYIGDDGLVYVE